MDRKEITLAYLAGTLDGDGSFSLIKGTSHSSVSPLYYPMIQLANAYKGLIDLLYEEFGGSVGMRKSYIGHDGSKRLASYQWKLEKSPKCLPVLEVIIPYLIIKKDRAQILRNYIVNNPFVRGSNKLSEALLASRESSYLKMRKLNDIPATGGELHSLAKRIDSNDDIFWSYVAGVMDTDGSFSLKKETRRAGCKNPVYTPVILLSMTDCRAIYHIMNNFVGGNIVIVKAKTATNGFCYRLSISSRDNAIKFLEKCIPFLFIKKYSAEQLLHFCKNSKKMNGKSGISEQELLFREQIYENIKLFNNGVYKSPLIVLKTLTGDAEGNKVQAAQAGSMNAVSEETSGEDAVL